MQLFTITYNLVDKTIQIGYNIVDIQKYSFNSVFCSILCKNGINSSKIISQKFRQPYRLPSNAYHRYNEHRFLIQYPTYPLIALILFLYLRHWQVV